MSQSSSSSGGIGLFGVLAILFIGLKLGGVIQWICAVFFVALVIAEAFDMLESKAKR